VEDALKIGFYVILLLPGFIFVQTREYHLLRERRPQFEKTLDIVLWSAAVWILACALPIWWPCKPSRTGALLEAAASLRYSEKTANVDWQKLLTVDSAVFFGVVCLWTFIAANLWGIIRKSRYGDAVLLYVTGRDWYPTVAHRFFKQSIGEAVIVTTHENRYLGMLLGAPDTKEDPYIIIDRVSRLPNPVTDSSADQRAAPIENKAQEIESLPLVRWVLIKFNDVDEVQTLTKDAIETVDRDTIGKRLKSRIFKSLKLSLQGVIWLWRKL
jgi:hypothetical protein